MIKLKNKVKDIIKVEDVSGLSRAVLVHMGQGRDFRTSSIDKLCAYYNMQPCELFERIKEEEGKEGEELKQRLWYNKLKNKRFDKLYALLEERGISRYRLSLDCGLDKDSVAKMKNLNASFSYDTVKAFTKYLNCELCDICEWDSEMQCEGEIND